MTAKDGETSVVKSPYEAYEIIRRDYGQLSHERFMKKGGTGIYRRFIHWVPASGPGSRPSAFDLPGGKWAPARPSEGPGPPKQKTKTRRRRRDFVVKIPQNKRGPVHFGHQSISTTTPNNLYRPIRPTRPSTTRPTHQPPGAPPWAPLWAPLA